MPYVAPDTFNRIVLLRPSIGPAFNQRAYTVAASQTIKKGDLLKLTVGSAGVLTCQQAIALPSSGQATLSGGNLAILGVALEDFTANGSGTETATGRTTVNVAIFDANLNVGLRVLNCTSNGAITPSSVASDSELQDLTLGVPYQFGRYYDGTTSWYFLSPVTTNGELVYIENYAGSAPGDNFGVAWLRAAISETIQHG